VRLTLLGFDLDDTTVGRFAFGHQLGQALCNGRLVTAAQELSRSASTSLS
jgi:hypothetical protein